MAPAQRRGFVAITALVTTVAIASGCSLTSESADEGGGVRDESLSDGAGDEIGRDDLEPGSLDAPIYVDERWWRSPNVEEPGPDGDPRLPAAAEAIRRYFGTDDATEMLATSVGAAEDLARFMVTIQALTGTHPMEPVTQWESFELESDDERGLLVTGRISEDRATGSGHVERRIFDRFELVERGDGELRLASYERNGVPIGEETVASEELPPAVALDRGDVVRIEGVHRTTIGVVQVAGRIVHDDPSGEPVDLVSERIRLHDVGTHEPRFVDREVADDGDLTFLLSFAEEVAGDDVLTLELWLDAQRDPDRVTFEFGPL